MILCMLSLTLSSCSSILTGLAIDSANDLANGTTYKKMKAQEKAKQDMVIKNY